MLSLESPSCCIRIVVTASVSTDTLFTFTNWGWLKHALCKGPQKGYKYVSDALTQHQLFFVFCICLSFTTLTATVTSLPQQHLALGFQHLSKISISASKAVQAFCFFSYSLLTLISFFLPRPQTRGNFDPKAENWPKLILQGYC